MNTKLTTAVEAYFADLRRVRASGGATLKPKVFCKEKFGDGSETSEHVS